MLHQFIAFSASIALCVQLLLLPASSFALASSPRDHSTQASKLLTGYFTENKGQWDASIRYVSRNDQQVIAVTLDGVWTFNPKETAPSLPLASMLPKGLPTLPETLPMEAEFSPFPASHLLNIQPEGLLPHVHHYFIGNDSNRWATHCRNYSALRIQDPGQKTDLMLSFQGEELKLSPFASSSASTTIYSLDQAKLINGSGMDTGMLVLDSRDYPIIAGFTTSTDFMQDEIPEDQLELMGESMAYVLKLDPLSQNIEFVTFIGGSGTNMLLGFHLNSKDQILLSGATDSSDFPIHQPLEGMDSMEGKMMFMAGFVVMLSPDGSELTHSSYFFGPESMMTMIMSQNLDHQQQWFFYSILFGTEGFEHDHALVEESDDELDKMMGSYLIQIDMESFTITKRILVAYGMTMVLSMDASPDGHLFMTGMSMDLSSMMGAHQNANQWNDDDMDLARSYSVILDPDKKAILAQLDFASEELHIVPTAKWRDDSTLMGIAYEVNLDTFLSLSSVYDFNNASEEFPLPKNYLFSYQVPEQKLETFTIGSEEEDYMFGNLYFDPQGQLCLLGSLSGQESDFSLPFIEEGDLEEEEYRQAFLLVLEPDTHEILNFISFGGPAINASVYMGFSQEGSLHVLGQSADNSLYTLSPIPNDQANFYDLKLFLLTLSPSIDDQNPPQIKLDQEALSYTNKPEATISGSILDQESPIKLATINQQELSLNEEGKFSLTLVLEKGSNSFLIEAWDTYNNKAELSFELVYDTHAPLIDLGKVEDFYLGTKKDPGYAFKVTSSLSPVKRITVTVNDSLQYENLDSGAEVACMAALTLQKGENKIRFTAWNMAGNQAEKEFVYWLGVTRSVSLKVGSNKAQISIDGQTEEVTLDTPPIIVSGRTMVPLRFIATALGAEVTWQASDQSILIVFQGKRLTLWIGLNYAIMVEQKEGQVISKTMDLDQAPFIQGGRTMVPLRFIAEAFGAMVDYEAPTQKITLSLIALN
jgi:hypothetical protein